MYIMDNNYKNWKTYIMCAMLIRPKIMENLTKENVLDNSYLIAKDTYDILETTMKDTDLDVRFYTMYVQINTADLMVSNINKTDEIICAYVNRLITENVEDLVSTLSIVSEMSKIQDQYTHK